MALVKLIIKNKKKKFLDLLIHFSDFYPIQTIFHIAATLFCDLNQISNKNLLGLIVQIIACLKFFYLLTDSFNFSAILIIIGSCRFNLLSML